MKIFDSQAVPTSETNPIDTVRDALSIGISYLTINIHLQTQTSSKRAKTTISHHLSFLDSDSDLCHRRDPSQSISLEKLYRMMCISSLSTQDSHPTSYVHFIPLLRDLTTLFCDAIQTSITHKTHIT